MACETIFQGLNEANSEKYQSTELLLAMTKELQKANPKKIIDDNNDKKNNPFNIFYHRLLKQARSSA